MARADLLISLVKTGMEGDREEFRKAIEALIAEEREKQHHVLADKLNSLMRLKSTKPFSHNRSSSFISDDRAREFIQEVFPKIELDELSLTSSNRAAVDEFIEEHHRSELLRAYNMDPRHKVLLFGPPGNGKTSLAEAIAESLSLPLLVVQYDAVVGSYLGETASRLRRVFDFCKTNPCVLFLDEFDALAKERGDTHETGEIKRVVSSLLTQIDDLPHYVIVVAASNHPELLDRAVWRRFQVRLSLENPTPNEAVIWVKRYLERLGHHLNDSELSELIVSLSGQSYAEIKERVLAAHRRFVLNWQNVDFCTSLTREFRRAL